MVEQGLLERDRRAIWLTGYAVELTPELLKMLR